jgi:hypothetical protein
MTSSNGKKVRQLVCIARVVDGKVVLTDEGRKQGLTDADVALMQRHTDETS